MMKGLLDFLIGDSADAKVGTRVNGRGKDEMGGERRDGRPMGRGRGYWTFSLETPARLMQRWKGGGV